MRHRLHRRTTELYNDYVIRNKFSLELVEEGAVQSLPLKTQSNYDEDKTRNNLMSLFG